LSSRTSTGAKR